MLIERKLLVSEFDKLILSKNYDIVYLDGSPESRRSNVSFPENSLLLRNLDFQSPRNNSLLLKLSFDGFIDPGLFGGEDYACICPDICQFIPESSESDIPPYISLIKLSSWFNIKNARAGDCATCSASRNLDGEPYCPIADTSDHSDITFGIYFPLTREECTEFIKLRDSDKPRISVAGISFILNAPQ